MTYLVNVIFIFLFCFFNAPLIAQGMGLKELVSYGLDHSPKFKAADLRKASASLKIEAAENDFFPVLYSSIGGEISASKPPRSLAKPSGSGAFSLGVSQTIWDGGIRSLNLEAERLNGAMESLEYQQTRDELGLEIVKAYLAACEAALDVSSLEIQSTYLSKQQAIMADAYRQGMRLKRDYIRMQTALQRHEIQLLQAKDLKEQAITNLFAKIGATRPTEGLQPKLLTPEKNLPKLWFSRQDDSIQPTQTTDGKKDLITSQIDQNQLALARTKNVWPSFDLSVTSQYTPWTWRRDLDLSIPTTESEQTRWAVALSMRYVLWDGGRSRNQLELAMKRSEEAKFGRISTSQDLEQKLRQLRMSLAQTERSHQLNVKLLDLEDAAYREVEADFRQGKTSFLDILDALQKLLETKRAHAMSYFGWLRFAWELEFYRGDLHEIIQRL
jgi:outer membrane protein TolC